MKKIKIAPSILSADFSQLGKEIKRLEDGGADLIHVDVMDGHFVPNLTIGPPVIKALKNNCKIKFDVHLMISPVHKYIEAYSDAGADIITIHPEATEDLLASINKIKELKKKVGLSLNPETKVDVIKNHLSQIDLVLIMSVNPGFGGQKFMPEVLDKIKELKQIQKIQNLNFDIEIDGGINFENYKIAIKAGANILVSGTTIFKSNNGDIKKNIELLKST
jgi:ribulose-phosphate 3-epimerase